MNISCWRKIRSIGQQTTSPPDQLLLVYPEALVFLRGWRLELMLGPLVTGRVARVHAEKHLGTLDDRRSVGFGNPRHPLDSSRLSSQSAGNTRPITRMNAEKFKAH